MKTILMIGSTVEKICRLFNKGGTGLPGFIAIKLYPNIVNVLAEDVRVILVSGTNGKTTTVHMMAHMLIGNGIQCIHTSHGENIESGIVSILMKNIDRHSLLPVGHLAVIECDEKYLPKMIDALNPICVTITNILCDQTDRLGQPEEIAALFAETLKDYNGRVCCDMTERLIAQAVSGVSRDNLVDFTHFKEKITVGGKIFDAMLSIPGDYNISNAAAAIASLMCTGLFDDGMLKSLPNVPTLFGRMETFNIGSRTVILNMAKNAVGVAETMKYILKEKPDVRLIMGFYDNAADGRDLSWLQSVGWDDYDDILSDALVYAAGGRRQAEYLPFSDISKRLILSPSELLREISKSEKATFMMLNYSCMMEVRNELARKKYIKQFWE